MVALLTETNALKMPILQIKNIVEETQVTVEESKRTVENIFKAITGPSQPSLQIYSLILTIIIQTIDGSRF